MEYLKTPLDEVGIADVLKKSGLTPRDIIRSKEHAALGLPETDDDNELIQRIVTNPQIMQRPIAVAGNHAKVCRPAELVLELL